MLWPKNRCKPDRAGRSWIAPSLSHSAVLSALSWVGVLLAVLGSLLAMCYLPAVIPTHFNVTGSPDGYGRKTTLLYLPMITLIVNLLYALFFRRPAYRYKYPIAITPQNAERQYRLAKTFHCEMRVLSVWTLVFINAQICYSIFRGRMNPLVSVGIIFVVFIVILGAAVSYTVKARKMR